MEEVVYSSAYEENLNKEINLPSKKKEIKHCGAITYWPTSTKEVIQWYFFLNIMDYNA